MGIHATIGKLVAQNLNVKTVATQDNATELFCRLVTHGGGVPLKFERNSMGNPDYRSYWELEITNSIAIAYNDLPAGGIDVRTPPTGKPQWWSHGNPNGQENFTRGGTLTLVQPFGK